MRGFRTALLVAAVCVTLLLPACESVSTDTFHNGTYTGSVGQVLVIHGDGFSYTLGGQTLSGSYTISGDAVTFNTTEINGQITGLNQRTTFDFTNTSSSITPTDMRDMENGGCGMGEDTFTK